MRRVTLERNDPSGKESGIRLTFSDPDDHAVFHELGGWTADLFDYFVLRGIDLECLGSWLEDWMTRGYEVLVSNEILT